MDYRNCFLNTAINLSFAECGDGAPDECMYYPLLKSKNILCFSCYETMCWKYKSGRNLGVNFASFFFIHNAIPMMFRLQQSNKNAASLRNVCFCTPGTPGSVKWQGKWRSPKRKFHTDALRHTYWIPLSQSKNGMRHMSIHWICLCSSVVPLGVRRKNSWILISSAP